MDRLQDKGGAPLPVTVVVCLASRAVSEQVLQLPAGATLADALRASRVMDESGLPEFSCGIWGRRAALDCPLKPLDRVEVYRALVVDPKRARRERFARQGVRTSGLFARQQGANGSGR